MVIQFPILKSLLCYYYNYIRVGVVTTLHRVPRLRFIQLLTNDIALVSSKTHRIFKVHLGDINKVEVFAGREEKGSKDGPALESRFDIPSGVAVDSTTNTCYLADSRNNRIRKITVV